MDVQQYASDPSDPLWEEPAWRKEHTTIVNFHGDNHGAPIERKHEPGPVSPRGQALREAAASLNTLCALNAPVAEVQDFLAKWEDPSDGGVQPNALAWFSDTNAVQLACTNESLDVLRTLLEKGLRPTMRAADFSRGKWRETKNKDIFQHILQLLVEYGLDLNQPVNDHTPPIMRLVSI
ncbi:hypothetical protein Daus18300_009031 [Diaporthe australafricana]|uniref:Ankyrin repeat protein n=1 Tax=Diaporthe australafricana TaxID=127596 RepID=A0ABR3WFR0_9PEZI